MNHDSSFGDDPSAADRNIIEIDNFDLDNENFDEIPRPTTPEVEVKVPGDGNIFEKLLPNAPLLRDDHGYADRLNIPVVANVLEQNSENGPEKMVRNNPGREAAPVRVQLLLHLRILEGRLFYISRQNEAQRIM